MKILIVCSSNVCRSPYAEFMLKKIVSSDPVLKNNIEWIKSSAVFNKSKTISPNTKKCLLREGFSENEIDGFKPSYKKTSVSIFEEADVIIGMTKSHKFFTPKKFREKFMTLSEIAYGSYRPIPDPFLVTDFDDYLKCMNVIKDALIAFSDRIKEQFENTSKV